MTALIACGGGSGGGTAMTGTPTTMMPPPVTAPTITPPTSSNPQILPAYRANPTATVAKFNGTAVPSMTYSQIIGELRTRASSADTLEFPDIQVSGGVGSLRDMITPTCNTGVTSCTATIPSIGMVTFSLAEIFDSSIIDDTNLEGYNVDSRVVQAKSGITTIEGIGAARGDGRTSFTFQTYAGWTDGSVFGATLLAVDGVSTGRLTSYSFGDASKSDPTARGSETSATWEGLAVGIERGTLPSGENDVPVQGDVSVSIDDFNTPEIDIRISNITSVTNTNINFRSIMYEDVALTSGTFDETTSSGQYVRGSFYGSNHEEVGGVFSSTNFYGAFGATRQ